MLKAKDWLLNPSECPGFQKYEITSHLEKPPVIHHTESYFVHIPKRYALVNLHDHLEESVARSGIQDGFCFVTTLHITAGIYINDAEPGLLHDISQWIETLAPYGRNYLHHQTGEDNGDAHLKSYLTNSSLSVPITHSKLDVGTWQRVFYAEFDGERTKRILVKLTGLGK